MTLKALREKRAEIGVKVRELADRQTTWTVEDRSLWEQVNKDFDIADAEVKAAKTAEEESGAVAQRIAQIAELESTPYRPVHVEQVVQRATNRAQAQELALEGWGRARCAPDAITDRHREAARSVGLNLNDPMKDFEIKLGGLGRFSRGRDLADNEMRSATRETRAAMGVSVDTLGGYMVPEGFVANLEYALRAYGGVRNRAEILRTETAQPLPWPTIADTVAGSTDPVYTAGVLVNMGEMLGENVATSLLGTPPAMGAVIFGAQKFTSKLVQISTELLRDSAFNLAAVIGKIIGERLGRITAQKWATGTGAGIVPRGIVRAATSTYTTASASGITFDDIVQFVHSIDPAYRTSPGACFLMHDKMVMNLRLLKDGVGRYLWSAGDVQGGVEPSIWGYPYEVVMEMPYDIQGHCIDGAVASTGISTFTLPTKLMLFGDVSKYKIREVGTIRLKRLVERFAEYDQDGFIGYMEADGDLIDAGTKPIGALKLYGTTDAG